MTIRVFGTPAPQGSKRGFINKYTGRVAMIEMSKKVKPWREAVKYAALEAGESIKGPVEVEMIFTIAKPKSAPKTRKIWPDRAPDLSKIVRATEDALTDAGAWEDDARIVRCLAKKVFPGEGDDALPIPGAVIRITSADSQQTLISRLA